MGKSDLSYQEMFQQAAVDMKNSLIERDDEIDS